MINISFSKTEFSDKPQMSLKINKNDSPQTITDQILKSLSVDSNKNRQYLLANTESLLPIDDNTWRFNKNESSFSVELINMD